MAGKARFKVVKPGGKYDGASEATVVIDRANNLVTVRPLRRRRTYEMRLEDLAEMVIWRCIKESLPVKPKKSVRRGLL